MGFILYRAYGINIAEGHSLPNGLFDYDELLVVRGLLRRDIKTEFETRIIFRFDAGIDSSLTRYSNHIFMYKKPIHLLGSSLVLDQPNVSLVETHREKLENAGFHKEKIGFLSLDERLSIVSSYESREIY